jgi:hypothetical protein
MKFGLVCLSLFLPGCVTNSANRIEELGSYLTEVPLYLDPCEIFTSSYSVLLGGPTRQTCLRTQPFMVGQKYTPPILPVGSRVQVVSIGTLRGPNLGYEQAELLIRLLDGSEKAVYADWPQMVKTLTKK